MSRGVLALLTDDESVFVRFRRLSDQWALHRLANPAELDTLPDDTLVVLDSAIPGLPQTSASSWPVWQTRLKLVVVSSAPNDEEGLAFLARGVSGYCHAYAAEGTLRQVLEVVAGGEVWIGRTLMARLIGGLGQRPQPPARTWEAALTEREREVARMASSGISNLEIGTALGITERTVKAHLTAIFDKLEVNDRLQLALKIHGIR